MVCFSAQKTIGDWDNHRKVFIVRLSLTAHIHDILILLFRHKIKEITRTLKCIRSCNNNNREKYKEHLLCINTIVTYFIGMLISATKSLKKRFGISRRGVVSHCPTIKAHLAPRLVGNNHKLYDEMPAHVLAE